VLFPRRQGLFDGGQAVFFRRLVPLHSWRVAFFITVVYAVFFFLSGQDADEPAPLFDKGYETTSLPYGGAFSPLFPLPFSQ